MKHFPHPVRVSGRQQARAVLESIGSGPGGVEAMIPKTISLLVKLKTVDNALALAIKNTMIGLGGDAAISKDAYEKKPGTTDMLLMGPMDVLRRLAAPGLGEDGGPLSREAARAALDELALALDNLERKSFEVPAAGRVITLGDTPLRMGIINCTPDSFYDGGKFLDPEKAAARGIEMAEQGAAILDLGGESTRPGADTVDAAEEIARVVPVIERLAGRTDALISVDTQKAAVAGKAAEAGASIINDVSSLADPDMARVAADTGAALVLMHMKGTPKTMQQDPSYDDLFGEIIAHLAGRMERAVAAGVREESIIVDPGIGFGKTVDHNLALIRDLWRLGALGRPILLGHSNKSYIGKVIEAEPGDRHEGTAASLVAGVMAGAHIVRVHHVGKMVRHLRMAAAIKNAPGF